MVYNFNCMDIWCFGLINGKLAEIYYEKESGKRKILGHCLVKAGEYKTKKEQKWIEDDTFRYKFSYRNKKYKDLTGNWV